jgi:hypothetical protein
MNGNWDITNWAGKKGARTQYRLDILKQVTREVVQERPELKTETNRLYSAVFAKLKRSGYFAVSHTYKKPRTAQQYEKRGIWNEKEFFFKGNYHWVQADISVFANETQIPLWVWVLLGITGFLLIRKLLK